MISDETGKDKSEELASDILEYCIRDLIVSQWNLSTAFTELKPLPLWEAELGGTDAASYFFYPPSVITKFKRNADEVKKDYIHSVLHCVFSHTFTPDPNDALWDLAADIFVEAVSDEAGLTEDPVKKERDVIYNGIRTVSKTLTVSALHRHLTNNCSTEEIERFKEIFQRDIHDFWPARQKNEYDPESDTGLFAPGISSNQDGEDELKMRSLLFSQVQKKWSNAAQVVREQLNFIDFGDEPDSLIKDIESVYRTRYNYAAFLRRFASLHEEICVNMDEFEYGPYIYGLQLYGNLPIIEPLEYREVKKIRDFVIVIDTSDSVSGQKVQSFLRNTYTVLSNTVSFFGKFNVYIIQCDAAIQDVWIVKNLDEFEQGLKTYKLRGFGGTDFRPAFNYVDELVRQRELTHLKGLIYFTDGKGTYPTKAPEYQTAFIFPDEGGELINVPPWAVKLILYD